MKKLRLLSDIGLMMGALILTGSLAFGNIPVDEEDKTKAVQLEPTTVIAPQSGVEITTDKTVIRMDEFKKPGTVRTITDVLTEIGGVDVQRISPLMSSPGDEVSIRGLNEGRMVIEIDGRRINHTGHVGRYIVDWSTLNIDDVERIEIIRGGHSVLHPFAIGGVINIVTKKGKKTDKIKPNMNVRAGYGDFNTYNLSTSIDGGATNFLSYNFSVSKQETDGYLRNNFQDTDSFNGHLTFHLPHEASLSLGMKYADVHYGIPVVNDPSVEGYDPDYPIFKKDADQLRHFPGIQPSGGEPPNWERHTSYLDAIFQIPVWAGTIKIHGFQTEGRRWTDYYAANGNFLEDVFSDDKTSGIIAEYRDIALFNSHRITIGSEYQELGQPAANPAIYQVSSFYVQDIAQIASQWILTSGVRYYYLDMDTYYSSFESDTGALQSGKEQTEEGFYPSLKLDYQVASDTALYAAVSRSYRLPCP